ncbi:MAG TPA: C1 family peptidase [Anaerolineaceae bacterium]
MKPEKSHFARKLAAVVLLASLSIANMSFSPAPVLAQQETPAPQVQQPAAPAAWSLDFELTPTSAQVDALGGPDQAKAQINDMLSSKSLDRYNATYAVEDGSDGSFHVILTGNGSTQDLRQLLYAEIAPEIDLLDGVIAVDVTAPVQAGQVIPVVLESRPATGYAWELVQGDSTLVQQVQEPQLQSFVEKPSAPAQTTLTLQSSAEGSATIHLLYRRPWEAGSVPTRRIALTLAEFPQQIDLSNPVQPVVESAPELPGPAVNEPTVGLPTHFDWRDQGKVPAVRDQGSCGSCWAFGTVAAMESAMIVQGGVSADLSEQFLISCNKDGYSCNGGWWAHKYHQSTVANNQSVAGAVLESSMPYKASNSTCSAVGNHPYKIGSWGYVSGSSNNIPSVDQIKNAIYNYGSVAVSVCSGNAWGSYRSGVFATDERGQCGGSGQVNHAVHLVGWDDAGQYWILRNSWGPSWGENGFMRIKWGTSGVGYGATYVVYQGGASPTQPPAPTATKTAPTATPAPTQVPVGPAPSNDSVNSPVVISYTGGSVTYNQTLDVRGATSESTDPTFAFAKPLKGSNTVWYRFDAAYNGSLKVKTIGSNYDTILGVWTRTSTGGFKLVKANDSYGGTKQSYVSATVKTGTTYYIEVASRPTTGGTLVFNLTYTPSLPANNRISSSAIVKYAGANKVTEYSGQLDVNRATTTTDEPLIPDGRGRGYRTVWYKFKPTQSGTLGVQTTGSNYNTVLSAYRYSGGKWVAMGYNDDWNGQQSGFQFQASAGTIYLIGVASNDASGPSKMNFKLTFTPQ